MNKYGDVHQCPYCKNLFATDWRDIPKEDQIKLLENENLRLKIGRRIDKDENNNKR